MQPAFKSFSDLFTGDIHEIAEKHRAVRYESFRKLDLFDIGTTLGMHKAMHRIDFLKVLPKG